VISTGRKILNLRASELGVSARRTGLTGLRDRLTAVQALTLGLALALVVIAALGFLASAQTGRLHASQRRATALTGSLSETQHTLETTKADLAIVRDDLATTKDDLAATKDRLAAASKKVALLTKQVKSAKRQLTTTQGQLTDTQGQLSDTRTELTDTQDSSARKSAVIRNLNVCLDGVLDSAIAITEGDPYTALDELEAVESVCRSSIDESRELGVLSA